jgi:hypothetical protein
MNADAYLLIWFICSTSEMPLANSDLTGIQLPDCIRQPVELLPSRRECESALDEVLIGRERAGGECQGLPLK